MPLPPPAPRRHLHNRQVSYRGFRREDGGWDIEGEMKDTKTYDIEIIGESALPAGEPVHHLAIRMTLDPSLIVREVLVSMDSTPHGPCIQAQSSLDAMVGVRVGGGWRKAIESRVGGVQGCTHLRELLFNMATATYQTIHNNEVSLASAKPPSFLGQCLAWDTRGPLVQRLFPRFYLQDINRNVPSGS